MKLRAYVKEDYEFCYDLFKSNMFQYCEDHWGKWDDAFFVKNFHPENIRIIVLDEPVGFFESEGRTEVGYLHDIQIKEEFRSQGIGTEIMNLTEKEFIEKGINRAKLRVFENNPAIKLYKRLGYKIVNKSNSVGTVVMEKSL